MYSLEGYYNGLYNWVGGYLFFFWVVVFDFVFFMYYVYVDVVWEVFWV